MEINTVLHSNKQLYIVKKLVKMLISQFCPFTGKMQVCIFHEDHFYWHCQGPEINNISVQRGKICSYRYLCSEIKVQAKLYIPHKIIY